MLQPSVDFGKIQPAKAAIDGVRAIVARLNAAEAEPVTVRLSGSVAMEHEELASVSSSAGIAGIATLLLVCVVLYVALRSWRLLAISVVTLFAGLSYTAAFAAATVGHLNLFSITFVVLNVGLGADYVIHVLFRYRELVAEGHAAEPALVETMRDVGSSSAARRVHDRGGFLRVHSHAVPRRGGARLDRGHRRVLRFVRGHDAVARARGVVRVFAARAARADAARPADLRAVQPAPARGAWRYGGRDRRLSRRAAVGLVRQQSDSLARSAQ